MQIKKSDLKKLVKEEVDKILNEEKPKLYVVKWTDRDYRPFSKKFKDDPGGAAENGLVKAKQFMKKLQDKDAKDDYGLYRSISVGVE